jgi:integrase
MSIRWDTRNKRWRYEFDRFLDGRRHRLSRLLPRGWNKAQAETYDQKETARLYAVASGIQHREWLIDEAVIAYLRDKQHLKSIKPTTEHLAAIAWAYTGKPLSALPQVARTIAEFADVAPATTRNRLACLKAACRWGWKRHGMGSEDPAARMQLPQVKNERHVYIGRREMLSIARACKNWEGQIAVRVAFYSGLRLGELLRVEAESGYLVLPDTKNGDRRAVPVHPKIAHLLRHLPLASPKITLQRAFQRAREAAGLEHVHFHDLRHSAASEMVNAGVDLYTVGRVLGHRDARSTQRYAHLTAKTMATAVGKIGRKTG